MREVSTFPAPAVVDVVGTVVFAFPLGAPLAVRGDLNIESVAPAAGVVWGVGLGELIGGGARIGFPQFLLTLAAAAAADAPLTLPVAPALDVVSLRDTAAALYSSRRSCNCWMRCCCTVLLFVSVIVVFVLYVCMCVCARARIAVDVPCVS
jgi:hypothetical protein